MTRYDVQGEGHAGDTLELFDLLTAKPDWQKDALCREYPQLTWFAERGQQVDRQRAICARCQVRVECLDYALDNDERFGLWGGLSEKQRSRIRRTRKGAA